MRSFPLVKATNESKGEFHDITRYISTQILASYTAQQQTAVKVRGITFYLIFSHVHRRPLQFP